MFESTFDMEFVDIFHFSHSKKLRTYWMEIMIDSKNTNMNDEKHMRAVFSANDTIMRTILVINIIMIF